jgi:hypothetical protein
VVFWESLKDTRPTAPKMSCGSGRANLGPLRIMSRSEQLKQTSLSDVVGHFCLYGVRRLKFISAQADSRTKLCVNTVSCRDFSRRRRERFGY